MATGLPPLVGFTRKLSLLPSLNLLTVFVLSAFIGVHRRFLG